VTATALELPDIRTTSAPPTTPATQDLLHLDQLDVLRGLAVLAVVAFHAGLPWASGGFVGVDVFFVLSGFLITRLLVVELDTTGTIALRAFEARRVRRLWPALALVVVATLALGVLLWSPLEWRDLMHDAAAGGSYLANVAFAQRHLGYFDASLDESPYLHLWSLGVEEQFYVAWPLLLLAAVYFARRLRLDGRRTLGAAIAALGTVSLCLMLWLVHQRSPNVFFLTPARVWELAAGGLIGLRAVSAPAGSRQLGHLCVALGLLPFVGMVVFPSLRPSEPLLQTIAPVAGTALLLEGIRRGSRLPISNMMAGALAWIGWYSYGWYLWHWPLVAGARLLWHTEDQRYLMAASALALAVAIASKHWVEDPIRFRKRGSLLGRLPTWGVIAGVVAIQCAALAANKWLRLRAFENPRVQALAAIRSHIDSPVIQARCPQGLADDGCILGDTSSARVLVVAGDSHAAQWLPALDSAGRALGLKVVPHIKPACPPWPITLRHYYDAREDTECATYQHQLGSILARYPGAALVLASSTGAVERMVGSLTLEQRAELWKRRTTDFFRSIPKTVKVIIVEKSPQFAFDPVSCLARSAFWNTKPACGEDYPTATLVAVQYTRLEAGAAAGEERVRIFPTIAPLCSSTACNPLVGNTVAFRDERHLTPRYTLSQTGRWMPYLRWAVGLDSIAGHIAGLGESPPRPCGGMAGALASSSAERASPQKPPARRPGASGLLAVLSCGGS
jgi:peptidoglycan/LPS O-acetylase OafA/YrhL